MTVENVSSETVMFKVKTTNPEKFRVSPPAGLIRPNQLERITVSLVHGGQRVEANSVRDKFLIMCKPLEEGLKNDAVPIDQIHKEFKQASSADIEQHRIRCIYPTNASPDGTFPMAQVEGDARAVFRNGSSTMRFSTISDDPRGRSSNQVGVQQRCVCECPLTVYLVPDFGPTRNDTATGAESESRPDVAICPAGHYLSPDRCSCRLFAAIRGRLVVGRFESTGAGTYSTGKGNLKRRRRRRRVKVIIMMMNYIMPGKAILWFPLTTSKLSTLLIKNPYTNIIFINILLCDIHRNIIQKLRMLKTSVCHFLIVWLNAEKIEIEQ